MQGNRTRVFARGRDCALRHRNGAAMSQNDMLNLWGRPSGWNFMPDVLPATRTSEKDCYGRSGNSSNASPKSSSATADESKKPWNSLPCNARRRKKMARAEMVTPARTPNRMYFFMDPPNNTAVRLTAGKEALYSRELTNIIYNSASSNSMREAHKVHEFFFTSPLTVDDVNAGEIQRVRTGGLPRHPPSRRTEAGSSHGRCGRLPPPLRRQGWYPR